LSTSAGTTSGSSVSTVSSLGLITVTRASVADGFHAPPMKCSSGWGYYGQLEGR
jgi:hypothetical protein